MMIFTDHWPLFTDHFPTDHCSKIETITFGNEDICLLIYIHQQFLNKKSITYTTTEQMRLIQELDEKDKSIVFGMIETMLTKKKFKDFFNNNIAAL